MISMTFSPVSRLAMAIGAVLATSAHASAYTEGSSSSTVSSAENSSSPASTPAADSGQAHTEIGDIVVTAQKTKSVAMRTPIAMTVYSGDSARAQGIRDITTLSHIDPGVNLATTANAAVFVGIRGMESQNQNETGDPAVVLGVDGFFANRTYTLNQSLYDLERIEVLRGPQGTLYGRNAIGGVINFITQKPTNEFGGYASITGGTYDTLNTEGAINVPISDKLQIRASWGTFQHGAYYHNPVIAGGNNRMNSASGRIEVAFEPTENLHALLSAQFTHLGGTGPTVQEIPFVDNATHTDIVHAFPADAYSRSWYTLVPSTQDTNDYRLHWEFTYDLPWDLSLTYTGGYDVMKYNFQSANDNLTTMTPQAFVAHERPDTQNEEIRLSSNQDRRLSFQAGLFYFSELSSLVSGTQTTINNHFAPLTLYVDPLINTHSYAIFGQASYKLLDTIKITGGLRQTWDQRHRVGTAYSYTNGVQTSTADQFGQSKSNKLTYHAGIDWTPTRDTLVYGKIDTGYKAGGFNSAGIGISFPYGPETSTVIEGGIKQQLFGRRATFTLAGFHNRYKGYQATLGLCTTCANTVAGTVNAGSATIWGVEGALSAIIPVLGTANVAVNYLNAKFTRFEATYTNLGPAGNRDTIPVDLAGNYLPQAPKWSISAGLDHTFDLREHGSLEANVQVTYRSKQYFSVYNFPETAQSGYALGNAYIQYKMPGDRYAIQFFVQNFTNKLYLTYANDSGALRGYQFGYGDPRVFGVKLTANLK